jgi:DNA-binding MarR family transcriptional regulator
LPYRLAVAAESVSRVIARAYQDRFGLTVPQWRILANLADRGPLTPLQLGTCAAMDKVTISRAARALEERGLLERHDNAQDGRSHILALNDDGLALFAAIAPLALEFEQRLTADLSHAEMETLQVQLRVLHDRALGLLYGKACGLS